MIVVITSAIGHDMTTPGHQTTLVMTNCTDHDHPGRIIYMTPYPLIGKA